MSDKSSNFLSLIFESFPLLSHSSQRKRHTHTQTHWSTIPYWSHMFTGHHDNQWCHNSSAPSFPVYALLPCQHFCAELFTPSFRCFHTRAHHRAPASGSATPLMLVIQGETRPACRSTRLQLFVVVGPSCTHMSVFVWALDSWVDPSS